MKHSFLKILLVPHDKGQNRWLKIPVFILFFVALILIFLGFFFFDNLQNFVNVASLAFLETDNQKLEQKIAEFKIKAEEFEGAIDSLLNEQNRILREHNIMAEVSENKFCFSPDSLIAMSRWVDSVFRVTSRLDRSVLKSMPSIMPVKGRIIRRFGEQVDPYTGKKKPHKGISILAELNAPVVSTGDGIVMEVGNDKGKGLFVEISHSCGFVSSYSHLLNSAVKEGESVKRGSVIGYVGQSGRAPYPYLYYEVKKGNTNLDPENFIFGGF
ncbi:MAG: M23 family metallopeptidase [candidate division WOR-3 bacterium]|jgi:murein DD-endopeptidase MepM/ murein hydrolase activator NlpD